MICHLLLQLRLGGQVKQKQRTSDLVFGVADIISFASRHVTLEPGDLIFTGTPGTTSEIKRDPGCVQSDAHSIGHEGITSSISPISRMVSLRATTILP